VVVAPARATQRIPSHSGLRVSSQQLQNDGPAVAVPLSVPGLSYTGEIQEAPDQVQGVRRNHDDHRDPAAANTKNAANLR